MNDIKKDTETQIINNEKSKNFNENVFKKNKLDTGAEARILESKGKLSKGSQKYSVDTYRLIGREGNRFIVEDSDGERLRRRLKPSEIQVVKATENKISRERMTEHASEKKSREILNKLVIGSNMTKAEAKQAVETLKTNAAAPSRSTRGKKIDFKALAGGK